MGAIVTDLLYFAISIALVAAVGQALSRSGRAFLHEVFGGQDGAAQAASRLLVVAFYLLSLGFVALTAPSAARVAAARPGAGAADRQGRCAAAGARRPARDQHGDLRPAAARALVASGGRPGARPGRAAAPPRGGPGRRPAGARDSAAAAALWRSRGVVH